MSTRLYQLDEGAILINPNQTQCWPHRRSSAFTGGASRRRRPFRARVVRSPGRLIDSGRVGTGAHRSKGSG